MEVCLFFLGAIMNAARGAQWRQWFGVPVNEIEWLKSDYINAVGYGLLMLAFFSPTTAIAATFFMWLGAIPGYGSYIGHIIGSGGAIKENRFIDPIISPLKGHPFLWAWAGLTLRGLWWGACLGAPVYILEDANDAAIGFLFAGILMPFCYWASAAWLRNRLPHKYDPGVAWGLGELFFGGILWLSLARAI